MQVDVLSIEERVASGFTHKITLPYTDFTSRTSGTAFAILAALGATASAATVPAGTHVKRCAVRCTTAFVAPSLTALTIQVGDDGDTDRFMTAAAADAIATGWFSGPEATMDHVYASANTIDILATATGAALSALTAGELVVLLEIGDLNKLF